MLKFSFVAALLGLAGALCSPAVHAATANGTFEVQINLTTSCELTPPSGAVTFDYISLQGSNQPLTANGSFTVRCTTNLPYTLALDRAAGDTATGTTYTYTDQATDLAYSLTLSAASGTGNGGPQSYTITGTMGSGQGGRCATSPAQNSAAGAPVVCTNSTSTNRTRTITLVY